MADDQLPKLSSAAQVAEFLRQVDLTPHNQSQGRLVFALDATASRQSSWDQACHLQAEMFRETARLGGLAIQLVWYRGLGEFKASRWVIHSTDLLKAMSGVWCQGGLTQIERVLRHTLAETRQQPVTALVFVGDCVEENVDTLYSLAGELGLLNVPIFIFHEGREAGAAKAFRRITQLSRGAYCAFDAGSAQQLKELLSAVAVYAAGGRQALKKLGRQKGGLTLKLTHQLG